MNLFADIDYRATANNVDNLLKNKLPRLAHQCGRGLIDLSSPTLSLAPSHTNRTDGQENSIVHAMAAQEVVNAIHATIFDCSELSKTILVDTYLKRYTPEKIISSLPYQRSQYFHKLKPAALVEFADRYDYWQTQFKIDKSDMVDLHITK